jgi:predicted membrane protein
MEKENQQRSIASHVFSGSTTMVGVCITIIALFKVMNISMHTYADEILSIDTLLFITAALFSYLSLRRNRFRLTEIIADFSFFTGMIIMLFVGFIIVFTSY